ncbi:MAG: Plug and carboxypeptidase regulatory-like domain-containing protein, partial [Bacteroidales bacterium]|nr:Plug and carboxypeptidase regulatory-like domain-containing protein [Bacteroidales bacterium]
MVKKLLISFGFLLAISVGLYAQSGTLKGYVLDKESKEPVPFANVVIQSDGVQKGGASADIDGLYTIKPIEPGVYTVMVSAIGFQARQVNNVRVIADQIVWLDLDLNSTTIGLEAVEIVDYEVPLISKDKTQSGGTVTSEEIEKMPEKSVAAVASTIGGVFSRDGEVGNIRGQRSSGTVYYIDGIKVTGSTSLP